MTEKNTNATQHTLNEHWEEVEQRVDDTEKKLQRQRFHMKAKLSGALVDPEEVGKEVQLSQRKKPGSKIKALEESINHSKKRLSRALESTDQSVYEAHELLDGEGKMLASLRFQNLVEALRTKKYIRNELEETRLKEKQLSMLQMHKTENNPVITEQYQALIHYKEELKAYEKELYTLSPEAFIGLHLKELKEYRKQLGKGGIVETPYVREVKEDIIKHLEIAKPVFISGHLGSGKTELAIHTAREMTGMEPLIISGAEDTSLSELYGHQVLRAKEIDMRKLTEYNREVELTFQSWQEEHMEELKKANKGEKESMLHLAHDRILQTYLTQFQSATTSDFLVGKVYQAMEEGRVLILDEVNAIPHEVLISLNHILTRKPGDVIDVQQYRGKEITIAEGFGVIATGNLNDGLISTAYIGRKELDLAWRNRFYERSYDYLPQKIVGAPHEVDAGDEQFHLLLTELMDPYGSLHIPEGGVRKIWNLAKAARMFQDIFSGKMEGEIQDAGNTQSYRLQQAVPSFRDLISIVRSWKEEKFSQELDFYVFKEFLSRTSFPSADKAFLYQTFQTFFDFFKSEGWMQVGDFVYSEQMKHFTVKLESNKEKSMELHTPRETVEIAFGKAPEREEFPEIQEEAAEISPEFLAMIESMESTISHAEGTLEKVDDIKATTASPISSN